MKIHLRFTKRGLQWSSSPLIEVSLVELQLHRVSILHMSEIRLGLLYVIKKKMNYIKSTFFSEMEVLYMSILFVFCIF